MKLVQETLGNWGRYQAFIYMLQFFPSFNVGALTLLFSFTGMTPERRCDLGSGVDSGHSNDSDITPNLDYLYLPDDNAERKYCMVCPDAVTALSDGNIEQLRSQNRTCTKDRAKECPDLKYVWKKSWLSDSMGMKWTMVCQEGGWRLQLSNSLTMIGYFIGAGVFGTLADKYGRKPVMLGVSYVLIITSNVVPILPNFPTFCVFQIINGALSHGAFIIGFNIAMELISGLPGTACGVIINGLFSIGVIYVGILAFIVTDWRTLHWAVSAWTFVILPYYWFLDESIRWLIVHGDTKKAQELLIKASKINGKEVNRLQLEQQLAMEQSRSTEKRPSGKELFSDRILARNTLIIFFTWGACSITYYGLSFNTRDIPGDSRVNFMISTLMEIPGILVAIPMLQKFGRRITMAATIGFAGLAILMNVVLSVARVTNNIPYIISSALGRLWATGAFAVVYVYSAELFPTSLRNSGFGYSSMCARVGSSLAPQIRLLGNYTKLWVPSLIYGSMAIVACALDMFLPETRNRPLPETTKDGIALHRGEHTAKVSGVEDRKETKF